MRVFCCFVNPKHETSRKDLIDYLEDEGFECEEDDITDRQIVLESRFPVVIDVFNKSYTILHTITSSAAAASSDILISEEEFYVLYKGPECTCEEYLAAVWNALIRYKYSDEEIAEFFASPEIEKVLMSNYADYLIGLEGCTPSQTANCLDLMYE